MSATILPRYNLSAAPGDDDDDDDDQRRRKKPKTGCDADRGPLFPKPRRRRARHPRKPKDDHQAAMVACTECDKKFPSSKALYGHMRLHPERTWRGVHPPGDGKKTSAANSEKEVAASLVMLAAGEKAPRFQCSGCKKIFGSRQALGGHRATHKTIKGCYAIEHGEEEEEGEGPSGQTEAPGEGEADEDAASPFSSSERTAPLDLNQPATDDNDGVSSPKEG